MNLILKLVREFYTRELESKTLRAIASIDDDIVYYHRKYEPVFRARTEALMKASNESFHDELVTLVKAIESYITNEVSDEDKDFY